MTPKKQVLAADLSNKKFVDIGGVASRRTAKGGSRDSDADVSVGTPTERNERRRR